MNDRAKSADWALRAAVAMEVEFALAGLNNPFGTDAIATILRKAWGAEWQEVVDGLENARYIIAHAAEGDDVQAQCAVCCDDLDALIAKAKGA